MIQGLLIFIPDYKTAFQAKVKSQSSWLRHSAAQDLVILSQEAEAAVGRQEEA